MSEGKTSAPAVRSSSDAHRGLADVSSHDVGALCRLAKVLDAQGAPLTLAALSAAGVLLAKETTAWLVGLPVNALIHLCECVLSERERAESRRVSLVWTGPEARHSVSRDTRVVVRELFASANEDVLVAGYAFDHGETILAPLHERMRTLGVRARFFVDPRQLGQSFGMADAAVSDVLDAFLERHWTFGAPFPELYYDVRALDARQFASLHAKCIVIDGRTAFVTSANFTNRGQTRNIEVGAIIEAPLFAERLVAQWAALVDANLMSRHRSGLAHGV